MVERYSRQLVAFLVLVSDYFYLDPVSLVRVSPPGSSEVPA